MSSIKILEISGSPRKDQNCEKIIRAALEVAKPSGFDTDRVLSTAEVCPCMKCAEPAGKIKNFKYNSIKCS